MTGQWWSWLLTAVGVTGLWLAGSRRPAGWLLCLTGQSLWASYAVVTHQWGFLAAAVIYGGLYARNLRRARVMAAADAGRVTATALADRQAAQEQAWTTYLCGAFQPEPPGALMPYRCTEPAGHRGDCRAVRVTDGQELAVWPRRT